MNSYSKTSWNTQTRFNPSNMNNIENGIEAATNGVNAAEGIVAAAFSTSTNYSAGQYCTYNDRLYRFTANKTAGSWDASKVTQCTAGSEIASINASLANKFNGTVGSGETILDCVVNRAPIGLSFWYTQSASDSPLSSTISFCAINKNYADGRYTYIHMFSQHIYEAHIGSSVPSSLTWKQLG